MIVLSLVLELLSLIDQAYKSIIGVLWIALIRYGLRPDVAFLSPFTSYDAYRQLELNLSGPIYLQYSSIIVLAATSIMLFLNGFVKPQSSTHFLFRIFSAVILGFISMYIAITALDFVNSIYGVLYSSSGINWSNFLLFSSNDYLSGSPNPVGGPYSVLIEVFTLTGYFTATVSLFSILMIRQALMLFAIIVLPFTTVLVVFNRIPRISLVVWEIIVEMSFYPFFVLLSLYLGHVFSWDVPLQLAFLFLPSILPGLLFASGKGFLTAPVLGFLSEMTFSASTGSVIGAAGIVTGAIGGNSAVSKVRDLSLMPVTKGKMNIFSKGERANGESLPWKEMISEELKYRRE